MNSLHLHNDQTSSITFIPLTHQLNNIHNSIWNLLITQKYRSLTLAWPKWPLLTLPNLHVWSTESQCDSVSGIFSVFWSDRASTDEDFPASNDVMVEVVLCEYDDLRSSRDDDLLCFCSFWSSRFKASPKSRSFILWLVVSFIILFLFCFFFRQSGKFSWSLDYNKKLEVLKVSLLLSPLYKTSSADH